MKTFKEYVNEVDGGNAGEMANASREQKISSMRSLIQKEVASLAGLLIQAVSQKTTKRWEYGETKWHSITDLAFTNVSNPGRLKNFNFTSDTDTRTELYSAALPLLASKLKIISIKDGEAMIEFNDNKYELSFSGHPKADIRITPKSDMEKWAEAALN